VHVHVEGEPVALPTAIDLSAYRIIQEGRRGSAIRTVAAGDALLSPTITKRVIKRFTQIPRRDPPKALDELTDREREVFRLIGRIPQRRVRTRRRHG
jgi:DNA-binding NarL/FixJ family response regulator